jgi:hypothetical protein
MDLTGQSRSEEWLTLCPKQTRKGKATPLSAKQVRVIHPPGSRSRLREDLVFSGAKFAESL